MRPRLLAVLLIAIAGGLPLSPALAQVAVRIEGLDGELRSNVELRLSILSQAKAKDLDQGLVESMHRGAPDDIRDALQPYGYYNPTITSELKGEAPNWTATYQIDPGPRTTLRKIDLEISGDGADALSDVGLSMLDRLREGTPLLHSDYQRAKATLSSAAYALGYLDAQYIQAELRIYADDNRADIVLHFDTGPGYRFGAVTVDQDVVNDTVVTRYVPIRQGDRYDPQKLIDAQFYLGDLGYFESINVVAQKDAAVEHEVPIVIETTPRKRTRYNVGAGYGTDTGARLTAGTEVRRLNREGHRLTLETRLSEVKNTANGEYRIPLGSRPGESIGLSGELANENLDSGFSRRYGVELSLSRIPGKWKRRYYVAYTHEESVLGDTAQTSDLLMPGLSLNRSESDNPIYTRLGWSAFTDVHGAKRDVVANTSFVRGLLILRGALPLGEKARLLGRYEFGAAYVEEFGELPASQRFFAGGDQSVRGYKYQSLGPRNADGEVVGGRYLTSFSIEVERRLWDQWGVATFFDAGGADDTVAPELYRGVGIGARYRAPIGSVQVDLAYPLDDPSPGIRIHLGVRVGL
ncbi:outer membrane protein assembly factor [Sinimarinibacterium sp. CAU 1509]|uniref:autotransporter assembly complex protein TamA n=1 Tax=Sinimarinibacterium sp. CAU 1509 TaxID=2562283 RepID=UPI0010AB9BA6|nr:autotransporter assembly complex family protein [Sinimarinibacterium sp. CAU 1509]TJY60027.1 outer membrane protein assembly factor [Sinimarinibacterium sp. CAU 1509]